MYIPQVHRLRSESLYASERTLSTGRGLLNGLLSEQTTSADSDSTSSSVSLSQLITWIASLFGSDAPGTGAKMQRRASTDDTDTTIGIVVGVILGVFLVATVAFLYVYRNSLHFRGRRRRRHRKPGSKSSKSSKGSDGGGTPPAPAAPPPPDG